MWVVEHIDQILVELGLLERLVQHPAALGLVDVERVAAHLAHQYREAGDHRFDQHHAGRLVVRGVNQQVRPQQETRNIIAALEELHLVAQAQRRALQLEYFGVVLADYK